APKLALQAEAFHADVCRRLTARAAHACLELEGPEVLALLPKLRSAYLALAGDQRRRPDCPEHLAFPKAHVADRREPSPLERVDRELSWSPLGLVRREIALRVGEGLGWDSYQHPGSLSLDATMALVEKLTIDSPVR